MALKSGHDGATPKTGPDAGLTGAIFAQLDLYLGPPVRQAAELIDDDAQRADLISNARAHWWTLSRAIGGAVVDYVTEHADAVVDGESAPELWTMFERLKALDKALRDWAAIAQPNLLQLKNTLADLDAITTPDRITGRLE